MLKHDTYLYIQVLAYPVTQIHWIKTKVQFCNYIVDMIKQHKDKTARLISHVDKLSPFLFKYTIPIFGWERGFFSWSRKLSLTSVSAIFGQLVFFFFKCVSAFLREEDCAAANLLTACLCLTERVGREKQNSFVSRVCKPYLPPQDRRQLLSVESYTVHQTLFSMLPWLEGNDIGGFSIQKMW